MSRMFAIALGTIAALELFAPMPRGPEPHGAEPAWLVGSFGSWPANSQSSSTSSSRSTGSDGSRSSRNPTPASLISIISATPPWSVWTAQRRNRPARYGLDSPSRTTAVADAPHHRNDERLASRNQCHGAVKSVAVISRPDKARATSRYQDTVVSNQALGSRGSTVRASS